MPDYIRARSQEHKRERMQEIINATDRLFQEHSYHEISLTTIAKELGWSRPNLYKYVHTKEEIFLEIYLVKQAALLNELVTIPVDLPQETFIQSFSHTFSIHLDFIKYHAILFSVIETNVSVEKLADFKSRNYQQRQPLYELLGYYFKNSSLQEIKKIYLTILYQCVGLYGHTTNTDLYRKAFELANLQYHEDRFEEMLTEFLHILMTYYTND